MSDTSSIYSNIFKTKKNSMRYLNQFNIHNDISYDIYEGNITKIFLKKSKFDWDVYVTCMLDKLELDIIPEITNINYNGDDTRISSISYNTNELISLRKLFETNNNFHYIIHELLSFLNCIKNKNVLIGNLNIDTIYANKNTLQFYILDISNTIFKESNKNLDIQSLYISLYDNEGNGIDNKIIKYFDNLITNLNFSKYSFTDDIIDAYLNTNI
jgi:hypothetical protein